MYRRVFLMGVFAVFFFFLGCSKSEEQVISEAYDKVKDLFLQEEQIEKNYTDNNASFYLPTNLHVTDEDDHNIILEGKGKTYIIFMNYLESPTSKTLYNMAKTDEYLLYEPLERKDMFGYIRINNPDKDDKNIYELQIGVGGIKVTTNVKLKEIVFESEQLMKIVKSIVESVD